MEDYFLLFYFLSAAEVTRFFDQDFTLPVFGFQGVADKLRAFCFLYAGRHSALQGTPENPIPRDFFGKIKWYKKRFFGLYLLYLAMVNNYRVERERKKKNGSGGGPT